MIAQIQREHSERGYLCNNKIETFSFSEQNPASALKTRDLFFSLFLIWKLLFELQQLS